MKKIVDCQTGEVTERELLSDEIVQQEADELIIAELEAIKAQEELAKSNAKTALLERLGITEEEAKLLLG